MVNFEQIEIRLSKRKLTLMLIGSAVFVVLGVSCATSPEKYRTIMFPNASLIFLTGIASIIFFGICAIAFIIKIADKRPGLIISDKGIFDNSSGVSGGFIPWSDIVEIGETEIKYSTLTRTRSKTLINIIVKNPQDYIDKQKSYFKRRLMQINYDSYNSVIGITSNGLQYNYAALKNLLKTKFEEYKQ
jgi:hypothetical protein